MLFGSDASLRALAGRLGPGVRASQKIPATLQAGRVDDRVIVDAFAICCKFLVSSAIVVLQPPTGDSDCRTFLQNEAEQG